MGTQEAESAGVVRRFAHFGTFDVENYGDLLFPLILERRLANESCEWIHVSPVGGEPVWGDCVSTISTAEAMFEKFDGIVVGGGHIIHGQASDVAPYASSGDARLFAYADLWLGASVLANRLEVPIVWNAPGVPGRFAEETAGLVDWAASEADYLAVRDPASRLFLEQAGFSGDVTIGLDTALEVHRLWSTSELDAALQGAFASRDRVQAKRSIAVHCTARYFQGGLKETARLLDDLCRTRDATAILLAIGPCHGDASLQREMGQAMETSPLIVDRPQSLRELAACIQNSELYLGSSLHGAITATAFDRPAVLVGREVEGGQHKMTGFIERQRQAAGPQASFAPVYTESWAAGVAEATRLQDSPAMQDDFKRASVSNETALDHHWARLAECLLRASNGSDRREKKAAGRARLDALTEAITPASDAYRGILLDQARSAAQFRETSQRNAQRYRELDRLYRDLKKR